MVESHDPNRRRQIRRRQDELLVGLNECVVEELPKRIGDALAPAGHVRGDQRRVGDHLILEPGIELHVPRLVDLLCREEGRLLLAAMRADQPRELGRDSLLGHHQ